MVAAGIVWISFNSIGVPYSTGLIHIVHKAICTFTKLNYMGFKSYDVLVSISIMSACL